MGSQAVLGSIRSLTSIISSRMDCIWADIAETDEGTAVFSGAGTCMRGCTAERELAGLSVWTACHPGANSGNSNIGIGETGVA
jgi:hypothetical protein